MDIITALAVSISLLGGLATWLFLGPIGGLGLSIWAAFLAWGSFYHCGGKMAGLQKTILHNIFGAGVGWVALMLVTQVPLAASLGLPLWAGIVIVITVFILVMAAKSPMFSDIPAGVFGFASIVAFALAGDAKALGAVTSASLANPFFNIVVSMVIGAIFGYISEKVADALAKKDALLSQGA